MQSRPRNASVAPFFQPWSPLSPSQRSFPGGGAQGGKYAKGMAYHDRNGNQKHDAGEPGVPGVRVSNGREVVQTDAQGAYRLPVDDDTILFLTKPKG